MKHPLIELLAEPTTSVAVVGATDNAAKFGYEIYRDLKTHGYPVWPVNPNRETVDGDLAYPNVSALPEAPTIIDFVVPAEIGRKVAEEAINLGYRRIWLQPGADSPELISYLEEEGAEFIADACIMVLHRVMGRRL